MCFWLYEGPRCEQYPPSRARPMLPAVLRWQESRCERDLGEQTSAAAPAVALASRAAPAARYTSTRAIVVPSLALLEPVARACLLTCAQ
eukprot:13444977-Alexandrium_andersonii.AAC.1